MQLLSEANGAAETKSSRINRRRGCGTPTSSVTSLLSVVSPQDNQSEQMTQPVAHDDMFNELIYLAVNPDVAEAVKNGTIKDAYTHWQLFGAQEYARDARPSILNMPDVAGQDGISDAMPVAAEESDPAGFDAETYLYSYPDIRRVVGGNLQAAEEHWHQHGKAEGRQYPGTSPFQKRVATAEKVLAKPFGINIFGPLAAVSGLGAAARNMVRSLQTAGIPIELWNYDVSCGYLRVIEADRQRRPHYRINLLLANADMLAGLFRAFPAGFFDAAYNVGLWQWELPSFRQDWFTSFGAVDEVWTNSEFQRAAIGAFAPVPVINIPMAVWAHSAATGTAATFGIPPDKFVFLCAFDAGSTSMRKNPLAAVRAFAKGFGDRDDVVLVVKFHSTQHEPHLRAQLAGLVKGLRNIVILPGRLSDAEMAGLRAACDCLVSPHRSEGFGLNIAEFMALGKPVVATNYSGNLDYFDAEVGYPVAYRLVEVNNPVGPYFSGHVWAEPDIDSLAEQMRAVVDDPAEAARRGARAAARIHASFNHQVVGQAVLARFKAIDLDAPPIRFLETLGRSPGQAVFGRRDIRDAKPANLPSATVFSIVVPVFNVPGPLLERCIESVMQQSYPLWELCLCNDGSTRADTLAVLDRRRGTSPKIKIHDLPRNSGISVASNAAAEMAVGEFLIFLDNDDELTSTALEEAAAAIAAEPAVDCIYSDEEKIDADGQFIEHFFKPDWSPEHLESVMYVLHMLVVRKSLFYDVGRLRPEFDGAQDYDLMLRCARSTDKIRHLARPLYRWRAIPGSSAAVVDAKPGALDNGLRALQDHAVQKYGKGARAEKGLTPGTFRLRRPLSPLPVTLLILTNNATVRLPGRGQVRVVDNLVESILRRTEYPNFEIVVVDNSSLDAGQVARFKRLGVRVENFEHDGRFNYAAKANYAVSCSKTEHLVILNDDMEVISPDWLTALMELTQDLEVGGVGARLLHFDGTIQHVGMVLGVNGGAGHIYHSFPGQFIGYNAFTHIIRNYSVVTGACFATKRSVLAQVGGMDEAFAVDFNDIDLCLRIRKAGYRIVYTPFAELFHFEQASLPRTSADPAEAQRFADRWSTVIDNDPFYNVNLARERLDFTRRVPLLPASASNE